MLRWNSNFKFNRSSLHILSKKIFVYNLFTLRIFKVRTKINRDLHKNQDHLSIPKLAFHQRKRYAPLNYDRDKERPRANFVKPRRVIKMALSLACIEQPLHYAAYPSAWPVIKAVSHFYETKMRELSNKYIYISSFSKIENNGARSGVVHLLNVEIYIRESNFFLLLFSLESARRGHVKPVYFNGALLRVTQLSFSRRACIINHPFKTFIYPPSIRSMDTGNR